LKTILIDMKLFAELNREQIRAAATDSLVVLPIGATEQHGPHLATGMDYFTVESVAREAASIASAQIPIVVTPALPFGSSHHHFVFGGTLSLSTETYYRVLYELVESLVTDGFTRIFLLNGHGGNHELAQLAVRDIVLKYPVRAAAGSYWTIAWDALVGAGAHVGRGLPGHAGDFETSLMLSLRPELVADDRPRRESPSDTDPSGKQSPFRDERHGWWKGIGGFTDSPAQADAKRGGVFREVIAKAVGHAWVQYYNS
jgi:creatinine amidohydrolase